VKIFKLLAAFAILAVTAACTDSGPETWTSSVSDANPVIGQKIRFQVYTVTDNPPMRFAWSDNAPSETTSTFFYDPYGNAINKGDVTPFYITYWSAPEIPGTYTVTCTVSDKFNKTDSVNFDVNVAAAGFVSLINPGYTSYAIGGDKSAVAGGIYAAVNTNQGIALPSDIRFFSANSKNTSIGWSVDYIFKCLYVRYIQNDFYPTATLWGGYAYNATTTSTLAVSRYGGATDQTTFNNTSSFGDTINDIQVIGDNIWVSADSGFYNVSSSNVWTNQTGVAQPSGSDFSTGLAAVATTNGVYYSTTGVAPWTRLTCPGGDLPGSWCNTLSVVTISSNPLSIYALTSIDNTTTLAVYKNTQGTWVSTIITDEPPEDYGSTTKISRDSQNRIWCGKNRWNGSSWDFITGIEAISDDVQYSIVSPEGLIYFLTYANTSNLWVMGKSPSQ
jgi:hypothetical protein